MDKIGGRGIIHCIPKGGDHRVILHQNDLTCSECSQWFNEHVIISMALQDVAVKMSASSLLSGASSSCNLC